MKYLACLLLCAACPPATAPPYGGPQGYGPSPQATARVDATCIQVFECLAACTQDAACYQGCMDRGNDDSRGAATALINCNSAGENAPCDTELQACRDQGAAQVARQQPPAPPQEYQQPLPAEAQEQMMPGQPHTTADLLPWLAAGTGYWQGVYYHYNFYGDGRAKRSSGTPLYTEKTGRYACATLVNETGTVTQEGDLLIMRFAAANESHCGDNSEAAPGRTLRLRIVWYQYNGPVELKLVDIDCQSGACSDTITRR